MWQASTGTRHIELGSHQQKTSVVMLAFAYCDEGRVCSFWHHQKESTALWKVVRVSIGVCRGTGGPRGPARDGAPVDAKSWCTHSVRCCGNLPAGRSFRNHTLDLWAPSIVKHGFV